MHRGLAPNSPNAQRLRQFDQAINDAAADTGNLLLLIQRAGVQGEKIQREMMARLRSEGYDCRVAYSFDQAMSALTSYLRGEEGESTC